MKGKIMKIIGTRGPIEIISQNYIIWGERHYTLNDFIKKADWHMRVNRYSTKEMSEYRIYVDTVEKLVNISKPADTHIV
jgi:hypothetical protein